MNSSLFFKLTTIILSILLFFCSIQNHQMKISITTNNEEMYALSKYYTSLSKAYRGLLAETENYHIELKRCQLNSARVN